MSFAWTTEAYLKGLKTETRRVWSPEYARRFKKDKLVQAYDRQPRFRGMKIGINRLTKDAYQQWLHEMTMENIRKEGGLWNSVEEFIELFGGDAEVWVVEFDVVEKLSWDEYRRLRGKK